MILQQTQDINLVHQVMMDDEMWDKVKMDGCEKCNAKKVMPEGRIVVSATTEKLIGVHVFVEDEGKVIYHPMLLKPYRRRFGRDFFTNGLKWLFNNTKYDTIEAHIPVSHKANINLAKKFNFKEFGIKKNGMKKDNNLIDLKVLRLVEGDL